MNIRESLLKMIRVFPGGWDAMAAALGTTRSSLQNRIYETKGQQLHAATPLIMQDLSQTTYYAEAVAVLSGGVFLKLAPSGSIDREDLHSKFQELYTELGQLSSEYSAATADNFIDAREKMRLEGIRDEIQKTLQELLALIFAVYCKPEAPQESHL